MTKRGWKTIALAVMLLVFAFPLASYAQTYPDPTADFYVNDFADVLSDGTKNEIIDTGNRLYSQTGIQFVVVTVDFTDGTAIDKYATELFNEWGIGTAGQNNGVLLLLSIGGNEYHMIQGQGLERTFPSSTIGAILGDNMKSYFDAQNYDEGVLNTYNAAVDALGGVGGEAEGYYVLDEVGALSDETLDYIQNGSAAREQEYGAALYVAVIKNSGSKTLDDYTYDLFDSLESNYNAVLVVLSIEADDYYWWYGEGVTGVFSRLDIMDYLEEDFAVQRYDDAVRYTAEEFYELLDKANAKGQISSYVSQQGSPPPVQNGNSISFRGFFSFVPFLFILLVFILIISLNRRTRYIGMYGVPYNPYHIHSWGYRRYHNRYMRNGYWGPHGPPPPNYWGRPGYRPPGAGPGGPGGGGGGRNTTSGGGYSGAAGGGGGGRNASSTRTGGSTFWGSSSGGGGTTRGGGAGSSSSFGSSSGGFSSKSSGSSRSSGSFGGSSRSGGGGSRSSGGGSRGGGGGSRGGGGGGRGR